MKKKILFTTLAAFGLFTLGACSDSGAGMSDEIVTYKGGAVTVQDYYNEIKLSSNNTSTLQNLVIYDVFEKVYGEDVSDDEVQDRYDEIADANENFATQLETYGYTEDTYKELIKQSLAFEAGMRANAEVTDEDLEAAWETFHPEVEAQIIQVADEETANDLLDRLNEGADFSELAIANSVGNTASDGGNVTFDSTSTEIPADVQTAAFDLENDQYSSVITVTDPSTYTSYYYIVKMVENSDKGDDMSEYEDTLKEIAITTITSDATFQTETIAKVLQDNNVTVKDDEFSSLLSGYLTTNDSSTGDSAATSSSSTASSESSTEESSTTESSTTESTSDSE